MALNELDGQAGFTDSTATDYDELVLAEELWWLSARARSMGSGDVVYL